MRVIVVIVVVIVVIVIVVTGVKQSQLLAFCLRLRLEFDKKNLRTIEFIFH